MIISHYRKSKLNKLGILQSTRISHVSCLHLGSINFLRYGVFEICRNYACALRIFRSFLLTYDFTALPNLIQFVYGFQSPKYSMILVEVRNDGISGQTKNACVENLSNRESNIPFSFYFHRATSNVFTNLSCDISQRVCPRYVFLNLRCGTIEQSKRKCNVFLQMNFQRFCLFIF